MARRRSSSEPFSLFAFQDIIMAITAIVILVTMIMTIELVSRANQMPQDASTVNIDAVDELKKSNDELIEEIKLLATEIEKARGRQTPGDPVITEDPAELKRQVTALEQQITDLNAQLEQPRDVLPDNESIAKSIAKLQSQIKELLAESTVIYKPSSAANRKAWILVCDENRFDIRPLTGTTGEIVLDQKTAERRMNALTQELENFNPRSDYFLIVLRPSATSSYFELIQAFDGFSIPAGVDLIDEDVKVMTATELGEI